MQASQEKIKSPLHLRLTNEQWTKETKGLTGAEIRVLYYVRTLDPFGDRKLDLQVTGIAKALECAKGTVSKALKKLDALELIELSFERVGVKITTSGKSFLQESEFPIGNQTNQLETSVSNWKPNEPVGNADIYIDRARALKTLKTNSDLITQERVEENLNLESPEINFSSTDILVAPKGEVDQKSDASQLVFNGQASAAVPLSPTTIYCPTKEDEALNFGRRLVPMKGTYASRSSDPWMIDGNNPNPMLVQWVINKKAADQKNLKEAYRSYTPSEVNVKKELRNDYASASDWWRLFLSSVEQRVEIHNSRVAAGIPIAAEEQNAIASIAPYTNLSFAADFAKALAVLEPVAVPPAIESASIPVAVPKGAVNPDAYKVFVAAPKPSEEETGAGRKSFNAKFKELTRAMPSMPKEKFKDTPTTAFAKNRAWLHSGEPGLRAEAISWAKAHSNNLEIDYDGSGNIIDFEEVQF